LLFSSRSKRKKLNLFFFFFFFFFQKPLYLTHKTAWSRRETACS